MLLSDGEGLVGVYFEKLDIENLGAGICRAVGVVHAVGNIAVCPGKRLGRVLRRRGESRAPLSRLAVPALGVSVSVGLHTIRLSIRRPDAGGDVALEECAASGDRLRCLRLGRLRRGRLGRLGRARGRPCQ